jgi:DNA-directed RNA polymerase specialized sigma24 family protein
METHAAAESLTADRFAEAYVKGLRQTARFLSSRCGLLQPEAEELAQAAWVQGWESRAALRNPAVLPVWVNSIALNLFRTEQRRAWRREELALDPAVESSPTAGIEAAEALEACSPRDTRLLVNRYLLGYSTSELASQENLGNIAVRVRISRARRQIREARTSGRQRASKRRPGKGVERSGFRLRSVA